MDKITVADARKVESVGKHVKLQGWVRTRRDSKGGFSFLEVNDGSSFGNVQVIAEHLDSDLRGLTTQALADAVAEKRDHLALYSRIVLENAAQLFLGGALIHPGVGLQFDVELAAVRTPGVLAQLGSADLLFDAFDVWQRQDLSTDPSAERQHFIQRGTGDGARHLHHKVPLAKVRHEGAPEERQGTGSGNREPNQHERRNLQVSSDAMH